jgi:type II secretory pathway pseudopilin PulG
MTSRTHRHGWTLMSVLIVLGVVAALGATLMSSMARQRLAMRRGFEDRQARWLAASVAQMAPVEAGASWKPSLAANSPSAQLSARIEEDPSGERRIVVESSDNDHQRIVYSEVLTTTSTK